MKKLISALMAIGVIAVLIYYGPDWYALMRKGWRMTTAAQTCRSIEDAIDRYFARYIGRRPLEHPRFLVDSTVLKQLGGENPDKMVFWKPNPKNLNKKGELLDPWGSVYHIHVNPDGSAPYKMPNNKILRGKYFIWSNGPNKKNEVGEGDDIRNWN